MVVSSSPILEFWRGGRETGDKSTGFAPAATFCGRDRELEGQSELRWGRAVGST